MLSKKIVEQIEKQLGQPIRYSKDCETLATKINQKCNAKISVTTLKRLMGFGKLKTRPRLFTLDILAAYLGHRNWDMFIETFNQATENVIEKINVNELKKGTQIKLSFEPFESLKIEYIGFEKFVVKQYTGKPLKPKDVIHIKTIELHHPIFICSAIRGNESIKKKTIGDITGVTGIDVE